MQATSRPRVKICCMMSRGEAAVAVAAGADAVGLVGRMPSGPGPIEDQLIAEIAEAVPPPVMTVLLTSEQSVTGIVAHQRRVHTGAIQLVDRLTEGSHGELRRRIPGVRIIQVVHVAGWDSVEEAAAMAQHVDALLLDSGRPGLKVKELGGTGRVHDWDVSRAIRERVDVPVFLAGGLTAENVAEAIGRVRPFAVDVCSGVRTDGKLDAAKLKAFMQAVREAESNTE